MWASKIISSFLPSSMFFSISPFPFRKIPDIYKIAYDLSMSSCILWLYPHQIPRGGDMMGQELLPSPPWVSKTKTSWVNDLTKIIWWVNSKRKTGTPLWCYTPASAVSPVPHSAAFSAGPRHFHECTRSSHCGTPSSHIIVYTHPPWFFPHTPLAPWTHTHRSWFK